MPWPFPKRNGDFGRWSYFDSMGFEYLSCQKIGTSLLKLGKEWNQTSSQSWTTIIFFLQFWWINWCFIYFGHGKRPETARRAQAEAPAAPMILLLSAANQNPVRKQSINSTYIKYSWYIINSPGQNGPNSKQAENGDSYKLKKKKPCYNLLFTIFAVKRINTNINTTTHKHNCWDKLLSSAFGSCTAQSTCTVHLWYFIV